MKQVVICVIALAFYGDLSAQYQKIVRSNTAKFAASESYATLGWSRQLDVRNSLTVRGLYFKDDTQRFSIDNFGVGLDFSRWLLRVGDAFVSGGTGVFILHTEGESAAATKADDFSGGASFNAEIEYYPTWWFVLFGEVRQMIFLGSDFFNSQVVAGGGLKFVF